MKTLTMQIVDEVVTPVQTVEFSKVAKLITIFETMTAQERLLAVRAALILSE
jgi:hypothetical protein